MALEAEDFAPVRLSLADVPESDRMAVYREVIGRHVVKWDLTPMPGAPLVADLAWRALPDLAIVSGGVSATVIARTAELIAQGGDGFGLSLAMGGQWRVAARGREVDETSSQACLTSLEDPSTVTTPKSSRFLVLSVPRAALADRGVNADDATVRPIPDDCAPLRLLRGYLRVLDGEGALATPQLRQAVTSHIHDVIALTVGATRDGTEMARRRGFAAARLHAIKADIAANLGRFDLSVGAVADRHGMTPRHLQRLFEAEGVTFTAYVLSQRLERAYRMLIDPSNAGRTVAAITFVCGFGDVSHFNRAFRRAYGATPMDVRARGDAADV